MYDKILLLDILLQLEHSMEVIIKRFSKINEPGDFAKNEEGQEKLDSICMQLLTIGESLKQIDKITNGSFLIKYPQIDWGNAKKMRDIIAHHYFDIDEEIVFNVCENHIPAMLRVVRLMIKNLKKDIKI